jgi:arylsulfatase A-like enzyme
MNAAIKPNIIMIMADDVGIWNVSAYHRGMMGAARRISIDSPAKGRCSLITTDNNPARRDARRSSLGRRRSAPGC